MRRKNGFIQVNDTGTSGKHSRQKALKISGQDIMNAVDGDTLLLMGIMKLMQEGACRREIVKRTQVLAWDLHQQLDKDMQSASVPSPNAVKSKGG